MTQDKKPRLYDFTPEGKKLMAILQSDQIDWDAFDAELTNFEGINAFNNRMEETILAHLIRNFDCGEGNIDCSAVLPELVRHCLACGYDVKANDGKNGGLALRELCLKTWYASALDAAKLLLDAGAPTAFHPNDDEPDEEPDSVLDCIEWEQMDAEMTENAYQKADILAAYYAILTAYEAGKDYHGIDTYTDCFGEMLTQVLVSGDRTLNENGVSHFKDSLILWLGNKPMMINYALEIMLNPLTIDENSESLISAESIFAPLIGKRLTDICHVDLTTAYLEFDGGWRLLLSNVPEGEERVCVFEIRPPEPEPDVADLENIRSICLTDRITYADYVTEYDPEIVALYDGERAYLLFTDYENEEGYLRCLPCSTAFAVMYRQRLSVGEVQGKQCSYKNGRITAIRFRCGTDYLYCVVSDYATFNLKYCEQMFEPDNREAFWAAEGFPVFSPHHATE